MATTRESIEDGVLWVLRILRIGVRRAIIFGVLAALFALAVILTTRDRVSDCGDVTDDQQELLVALSEPEATRSFETAEPASCVDGEFTALIDGMDEEMEGATEQLVADGWIIETNYIGYYQQLWRRCFRFDRVGWERVQITVDASRGGSVHTVRATAPEGVAACDLERRDTSVIFPP